MLRKALIAAVATGFVAATALTVQVGSAGATSMTTMSCKEAAKMKYPADKKARHAYKKACKEAWKAQKA